MKVIFTDGVFICRCSFEERNLPKESGFRWDQTNKRWFTKSAQVAARLRDYCDETAKTQISKTRLDVETWTGGLSFSKEETLRPFQENAALFALSRNRSYLGLDPGLGKTPIAATIAQTLDSKTPTAVVYICPPFLTRNTEAEFSKWAPKLAVKRYHPDENKAQVMIVPDSMINRDLTQENIYHFIKYVKGRGFQTLLVVDEAHRYKNPTAARTKALLGSKEKEGLASLFDRIVYLSGTPMPNRPMELFPILNHSAPQTIHNMNYFEFGRKYCAGHRNDFGWDFSGASNLTELSANVLGTFMLRMKKDEVLKELPPKTEEMVLIGENLTPKLAGLDAKILEHYSPEDLMEGRIKAELGADTLHLSTYRKELGIAKAGAAAEYINFLLEDSDESLLVFAIHTDVIEQLKKELASYDPLVITGQTKMEDRHAIVKTFQTDKNRRVFIGNIQAAGVGLTLTKATRVIFAEFSWVPADNDQASDRAHRIGQTDNVFVQYLVYKNSVDKAVIETVLKKRKITARL